MQGAPAFIIEAAPLVIEPGGGRKAAELELHAVGVARKSQVDVGRGQDAAAPMCRVVAQQDLEARTLHAVLRPHKVAALGKWRLAVVLDPDNGDAVSPAADHDVVVQEQSPAHVALAADKLGKVGLARLLRRPVVITHIVMVAQDGDNAVTGMQPGEFGAERDEFFGVVVHQVAREGNQIGLLRVHSLDNAPHGLRMRGEGAYMQVAHLHDAIAVECRRQVGRGIRNLPHFEGIGAKGFRAETPEEFKAAFEKALKEDGPVWIECIISREERVLPMIPSGKSVDDMITV